MEIDVSDRYGRLSDHAFSTPAGRRLHSNSIDPVRDLELFLRWLYSHCVKDRIWLEWPVSSSGQASDQLGADRIPG